MKDSKKFSERIQKAFRALKRKYGKIEKPKYDMSADSLVYAVLSEFLTESGAATAFKKLQAHYVDWNDLRVSMEEEVLDILGKDTPQTRQVAAGLTQSLFAIFNKYDVVNLEALAEAGKRQAKVILEKLLTDRYVINYVMLTAFEGHAVPLTPAMVEYLKANELIHPESTHEEIEGFLERQITVNQAYEFFAVLKKESETVVRKPTAAEKEKSGEKEKAPEKEKANNAGSNNIKKPARKSAPQ